jgi:hypothetical protein
MGVYELTARDESTDFGITTSPQCLPGCMHERDVMWACKQGPCEDSTIRFDSKLGWVVAEPRSKEHPHGGQPVLRAAGRARYPVEVQSWREGDGKKSWLAASVSSVTIRSVSEEARFGRLVDNFQLRILSGKYYPEELTQKDLEKAKRTIDSFTTVIDMACFDEGMRAWVELMGLDACTPVKGEYEKDTCAYVWKDADPKYAKRRPVRQHMSPRKTCGNSNGSDEAYAQLVQLNRLDSALYEHAKKRSLVRCRK